MKKTHILALAVLAFLAMVPAAHAVVAEVIVSLPTTNADNSTITPAEQATIVWTAYMGSSATGPWSAIATSAPGATTATSGNLTLSRGTTYWFTNDVVLHGRTSAKGMAISQVYDYATPNPATMIQIILKP